jgi:MinD-like ATPase involved in chromosome partitioning or flagellar assembly
VEERRRLGRRLEEISSYFISEPQPARPFPAQVAPSPAIPVSLAVASLGTGFPCAFATAILAVELGRIGRRVLVVDTAKPTPDIPFRAPNLPFLMGVNSSYAALEDVAIEKGQPLVIPGPAGVSILAFRLSETEMSALSASRRAEILRRLSEKERESDLLLVNLPFPCPAGMRLALLGSLDGLVLLVPPRPREMLGAYAVIKDALRSAEHLRVGLVAWEARDAEQARACLQKMETAAKRFLNAAAACLGSFLQGPHTSSSIAVDGAADCGEPLFQARLAACAIVRNLLGEKMLQASRRRGSFFEAFAKC